MNVKSQIIQLYEFDPMDKRAVPVIQIICKTLQTLWYKSQICKTRQNSGHTQICTSLTWLPYIALHSISADVYEYLVTGLPS